MLKSNSLSADKIPEILEEYFRKYPEMNRVRNIFYAAEAKLIEILKKG
ncbi:MAG: hypothetical protein LBJ71_00895 [Holosporaceae bacterium]|nr:hypothetical protein [Holosporaceae bacterium]